MKPFFTLSIAVILGICLYSCTNPEKKNQTTQKKTALSDPEKEVNPTFKTTDTIDTTEAEQVVIETQSPVLSNIIYADNEKITIKVDELENNDIRYTSWNKPKDIADEPDLTLYNGEIEKQDSPGRTHFIFKNEDWKYIVEDYILGERDEDLGIFLKSLKNNVQKERTKLNDLNLEHSEIESDDSQVDSIPISANINGKSPFIGVWGASSSIIIADGGEEGYYMYFGQDPGFVNTDVNSTTIEGTNFTGQFTIKLISTDPPQFLYSDDGRGHFAPMVDLLYQKFTSKNATLLIGKWQSTDDAKSMVQYTGYDLINYYDGKLIDQEPYTIAQKCMNYNELSLPVSNEHNQISVVKSDMSWTIVHLDETKLTLSYNGHGNTLNYKRVE